MPKSNKKIFQALNYKKAFAYYQEQREKNDSWKIKILIFMSTLLILSFFFTFHFTDNSANKFEFSTTPGSSWPNQNIIADFSFPSIKIIIYSSHR